MGHTLWIIRILPNKTFTCHSPLCRHRPFWGSCSIGFVCCVQYPRLRSGRRSVPSMSREGPWQEQETARPLTSLSGRAGICVPMDLECEPVMCPAQTCSLLVVQGWRAGCRGVCSACPVALGEGSLSSKSLVPPWWSGALSLVDLSLQNCSCGSPLPNSCA